MSATPKTNSIVTAFIIFVGIVIVSGVLWWLLVGGRAKFPLSKAITEQAALQVQSISFDKIEIADDNASRQMGLMNRKELCQKCGMLFVFEEEDELSFWMKNTFVSLDMIFMDKDGVIVTIHRGTKPQSTISYVADKPAKYVLEVNAGFAKENQLEVGTKLAVADLIAQGVEFGAE